MYYFSLLAETRSHERCDQEKVVDMETREVGDQHKVVMASKAGKLLKSVKLLLAREKSYDLSNAEGRKRNRRLTKSVSTTRYL